MVARDITERKRSEESLRESARRKDEFLAILAHELRIPSARSRIPWRRCAGLAPSLPPSNVDSE
jgi:hypothetical protein